MPRDQNSYSGAEFEEDEPAEHEPAEHDSGTVGDPAAVMEAPTEGRAQGWALGGNQDHQAEHRTDEALEQDLERTGHILRYVESVCGGETARQLGGTRRGQPGPGGHEADARGPHLLLGRHPRAVPSVHPGPAGNPRRQAGHGPREMGR